VECPPRIATGLLGAHVVLDKRQYYLRRIQWRQQSGAHLYLHRFGNELGFKRRALGDLGRTGLLGRWTDSHRRSARHWNLQLNRFRATWVPDNAPTNVFWTGMACSANGSKMAATATSMSPGLPNEYIYINVVPMPPLNIAASGTNVILSWPTNATGFRLTGNANLNTTNWVSVTNALNVSNDLNQVTLPANGSARFFRLQNP